MRLFRVGPDGVYAAELAGGEVCFLHSDPFETPPAEWEYGRELEGEPRSLLPPVRPGKIVGVGRNYVEHAAELGNAVPEEPLLFLKSPGTIVGPTAPIVLPPESTDVEFEGEIGVVLAGRLSRATPEIAAEAILGVTAACDVTARDLQRGDATFARAKSFDTFCPVGPAIAVGADLAALEVVTRVNGEERQRGRSADMVFSIPELLAFISRMMTLEPGDLVLTGTPAGVGPLADGDRLEVEVSGVGVLANPVRLWKARRA